MIKKRIMVYGASGGLGKAVCRQLIKSDYEVILAGRDNLKLQKLSAELKHNEIVTFDFSKEIDSLIFSRVDSVINCAGYDVRAFLENQSIRDIEQQISINLFSVINLTKSAYRGFNKDKGGTVLHIGGFGNGSWPTPCYTVDVATRAGAFAFIESINQEVDKNYRALYFCPMPTYTKAEAPYHKLWKSMGVKIVQLEKVAEQVVKSIDKSRKKWIMGGPLTKIIYKLREITPRVIDSLVISPMSRKTKLFFSEGVY